MISRARHLQEERLFDSYLAERAGEPIDPPIAEHLADCAACCARYAELAAFMDALRKDGDRGASLEMTQRRADCLAVRLATPDRKCTVPAPESAEWAVEDSVTLPGSDRAAGQRTCVGRG